MSRPALRGLTYVDLSQLQTWNLKNKQLMVPMAVLTSFAIVFFFFFGKEISFLSLSDSTLHCWLFYFLVSHFHELNNGQFSNSTTYFLLT